MVRALAVTRVKAQDPSAGYAILSNTFPVRQSSPGVAAPVRSSAAASVSEVALDLMVRARLSMLSLRFVRMWGVLGAERRGRAYQITIGRDRLSRQEVPPGLLPKTPLPRVSITLALHTMETASSTGRVQPKAPRSSDCACSEQSYGRRRFSVDSLRIRGKGGVRIG